MQTGAVVLTAAAIRPDYRSGRSYRHIVISGGKVRALAHTAAQAARAAGPRAFWADLGPACVGPGFIDTHVHALQAAADVRLVSLRQAASLRELLSAVREGARGRPAGQWTVSGRNWHESQLREGRLPTRAELDALGAAGPILLRRGSHLAVLNSLAAWRRLTRRTSAAAWSAWMWVSTKPGPTQADPRSIHRAGDPAARAACAGVSARARTWPPEMTMCR